MLSDIVSTPNLTKNQLIKQLMELLSDKTRYIDDYNVFLIFASLCSCYPDPYLSHKNWDQKWIELLNSIFVTAPTYGTR